MQKTENRKSNALVPQQSRGFTLLLASLVVAVVLVLGASIFEIAQKQLTLSSIGRDSQFAFYAADTAAECALYWDFRHDYFALIAPPSVVTPNPMCGGESFCDGTSDSCTRNADYPQTIAFQIEPNGYCAEVSVEKTREGSPPTLRTFIRADGFSTSCSTIATNPRTLQRSVEIRY